MQFGLWRLCGETSRKQSSALGWTQGQPYSGHLDSLLVGGEKPLALRLASKEDADVFYGLDNVLVFLLCSNMIIKVLFSFLHVFCLALVFCDIIHNEHYSLASSTRPIPRHQANVNVKGHPPLSDTYASVSETPPNVHAGNSQKGKPLLFSRQI